MDLISLEALEMNKELWRAKERLAAIRLLYPKCFRFERGADQLGVSRLIKPSDQVLSLEYERIANRRDRKFYEESLRTTREIHFYRALRSTTRKEVLTSFRIGNFYLDIFIPNVRSNQMGQLAMRGLAVEIDGGVHNLESKMKKDVIKYRALHSMGIGLMSVPNEDLSHPLVNRFFEELKSMKTLDSRERRRLYRRIWLFTLATTLDDKHFFRIFKKGPAT